MVTAADTKVKELIAEHLGIELNKVQDDAKFMDDLGADSLDTVELVMTFEEEFEIDIPDDEAENITTVGEAVKVVERLAPSYAT